MIRQLSPQLVNKIAAGEVVERPNSVIKELMENSIDANATEITVTVHEDLITVMDNGDGISKEDLNKLFVSHSTSKIYTIEDLNHILTMGFRGEAIATISSVSKMKIKSRTKESNIGYEIEPFEKPVATPLNQGTIVEVKELFYNVPARKKFMKSPSVENKHITDTFIKISLAHPEISFKLTIKDRLLFNLISTDLEGRVKSLIPGIKFINLYPDDIITGFISEPKDSFSRPTYQYMFVNNRYISPSPALSRAIFNGYKNTLMRGQYPPFIIFINVNPQEVDVNVHPRKTEVKFENEGYIFQKIYTTIQHTLFHETNSIFINSEKNEKKDKLLNDDENKNPDFMIDFQRNTKPFKDDDFKPKELFKKTFVTSKAMEFSSELLSVNYDKLDDVDIFTAHQYMNSYIATQSIDGLVLFDQHACSERYLFEKFKDYYSNHEFKRKKLLIPESIPQEHVEFLLEKKDVLASFGIVIEEIDEKGFITEIPEFATLKIIDKLYGEIRNIFEEDLNSVYELKDKMITTLACHSAIRFGDKLSDEECRKILEDLRTCKNKLTCPHGRPTFHELSKEKLREIFKR